MRENLRNVSLTKKRTEKLTNCKIYWTAETNTVEHIKLWNRKTQVIISICHVDTVNNPI